MNSLKYLINGILLFIALNQLDAALGVIDVTPTGTTFTLLQDAVIHIDEDINANNSSLAHYVITFNHVGAEDTRFDNPSSNAQGPILVGANGSVPFTNFTHGTVGDGLFIDSFSLVFHAGPLNFEAGEEILFLAGSQWSVDDDLTEVGLPEFINGNGLFIASDGVSTGYYPAGTFTAVPEPSMFAVFAGSACLGCLWFKRKK